MKYLLTMLVAIFCGSFSVTAQETTQKKVVVIKKIKDENGKVTTEEIEASGDEADKLLEELKKDGSLEGIDIDIEEIAKTGSTKGQKKVKIIKDVDVKTVQVDGQESKTYTITSTSPGTKKVMVWNGDGEMPADMAKKVQDQNMQQFKLDGSEEMIFIANDQDTEIELEFENTNKVQLGVMVDDSRGVHVDDVIADSPAHKAGIKKGDTILKVGDMYTFNLQMLMESLSGFDKGEKTKVTFIRNGKEKIAKVNF